MKLGLVTLMRNEADVIRPFLQHAGAVFDHAVLLDHRSTDGTAAIVRDAAERFGWHAWRVQVREFRQAAMTGFAAAHLFRTTDVDHVVLLDADEFLDVPGRAALEAALAPLSANPRAIGLLAWRNCIPAHPGRALSMSSALWIGPEESPYCKAIISRPLFEATGGRLLPSVGAHDLVVGDGGARDYHRMGHILHVPIRSLPQMKMKLLTHTLTFMKKDGSAAFRGQQWFNLVDRMGRSELDMSDLAGMAATYGRNDLPVERIPFGDLRRRGYGKRRLATVAHVFRGLPRIAPKDRLDQLATVVRDWRPFGEDVSDLVLTGDVLSSGLDG